MKKILYLILIIILLSASSCSIVPQEVHIASQTAFVMDTIAQVQIFYVDSPGRTRHSSYMQLANQAMDIIRYLDGLLNRHTVDSDVWRINNANGGYVIVSDYTAKVLTHAIELKFITQGNFDITIGAVTELWDFSHSVAPPNQEEIVQALTTVGSTVHINGNTVRLDNPYSQIDLGGIGKGFAADMAANFLKSHGVSAIINIGGDVALVGQRPESGSRPEPEPELELESKPEFESEPEGQPWRIGIQAPFKQYQTTIGHVDVFEVGIVTSGIYQRHFSYQENLYHHIIDPATGRPAITDIVSVSIIAPSATMAEGIATAASIMGYAAAMDMVNGLDNVYAIIVLDNGDIIYTPGVDFTKTP